ncbi:MAG: alpha/beta fold hydrolase [Pseudomonadota bacterium]
MPLDQSRRQSEAAATITKLGIGDLYPFAHNFVETAQGAMHYVDEGQGDPVLCLHGNPTWSFIWRDFVTGLRDRHRVVAPDHIGFGLSDKPVDEDAYTIERHVQNLEALVLGLDLRGITLVMQDWGGPIGLAMAARHPDRIRALVILNTFGFYPLHPSMKADGLRLPPPLLLMRSKPLGTWLVRKKGLFDGFVMKFATADSKRLRSVHHAYRDVFGGPDGRGGVMAFPRLIPTHTSHPVAKMLMQETGPFLDAFKGQAQIYWGMKDPLFPPLALDGWKARLPRADVIALAHAKHYLQEDAPEVIVPGIARFLDRITQRRA